MHLLDRSFPCLVHGGVHFLAEPPNHLWYQHTPTNCNGKRDCDQVLLLLLLLLLCRPVTYTCKSESCLLRLATSAFTFPTSLVCRVATVAMDGEITSIMLFAISTNCSKLHPLAVDARNILTFLGSSWKKSFTEKRIYGREMDPWPQPYHRITAAFPEQLSRLLVSNILSAEQLL